MFRLNLLRTTCALTGLALLGACAGYERSIINDGSVPSPELIAQAADASMSTQSLNEAMGPPTSVSRTTDGAELWVYDAAAERTHEARLLPLLAVRWHSEQKVRHVFEVSGEIVTRHWVEAP